MLVSHTHKFIYLKTKKTASTSVEAYLERFCLPPNFNIKQHIEPTIITDYGIVTKRGNEINTQGSDFYNHISAQKLKILLGDDIWDNYKKICVIRNPWDKTVSRFWWEIKSLAARTDHHSFKSIAYAFSCYVKENYNKIADDKGVFMIDENIIIDSVIRYEDLENEMKKFCKTIGEKYRKNSLPKHKTETRRRNNHYRDYYTSQETIDLVAKAHDLWIKEFNYTF